MGKSHEDKYREFILQRCEDVVMSCKTQSQLNMAGKYCTMFKNVYYDFESLWSDIWEIYKKKLYELNPDWEFTIPEKETDNEQKVN